MAKHKDKPAEKPQSSDIPQVGSIIKPVPIALQGEASSVPEPIPTDSAVPIAKQGKTEADAKLEKHATAEPAEAAVADASQESISDAQAEVAAQIEAAEKKLDESQQNPNGDLVGGDAAKGIGEAIDLEGGKGPTAIPEGYEPVSPYVPDPTAKPERKKKRSNRKLYLGLTLIFSAIIICVGIGAYSIWYVKTNVVSTVKYRNYQTVSVKGENGKGGFVVDVPAEFSQDQKNDASIEFSHHVPSDKGQGNYSGIAVNASPITDQDQVGAIDALKVALTDKDSEVSKQFVNLINGSLAGKQTVQLENYIEKSNTYGQQFFGYEINLQQNDSQVGKGWMLITTSKSHIYVMVVYGTIKVWDDNAPAWKYIFDSLSINTDS